MSEEERISSADRLLSREQVEALDNLDDLLAIQDEVTKAAKAIEVDLEYRTDDAADEYWEHRARKALTAHYVCNGHLTRRIAFLRRGGKAVKQGDSAAKARKKEAHAQLLIAQAEARRQKALQERETTVRQLMTYASRQSFLACFHRAAAEYLDNGTMGRLTKQAKDALEASLLSDLSPLAPPPDASNCPPATNGDTPSVSAEKLTATGDLSDE